jgi:hypothetical protein
MSLPSGLYPSGFPTKILYAPLLSTICPTGLLVNKFLDISEPYE